MQEIHHPGGKLGRKSRETVYRATPKKTRIGCVDNDAFNWSYTRRILTTLRILPWANFRYIWLVTLNRSDRWSQTMPAVSTIRNSWASNRQRNWDEGSDITRDDYSKGYVLYASDLSSYIAEEGHWLRNSNFERLYRTLWPSSPTQSLRTSSRLIATETLFTTLAVKHEH